MTPFGLVLSMFRLFRARGKQSGEISHQDLELPFLHNAATLLARRTLPPNQRTPKPPFLTLDWPQIKRFRYFFHYHESSGAHSPSASSSARGCTHRIWGHTLPPLPPPHKGRQGTWQRSASRLGASELNAAEIISFSIYLQAERMPLVVFYVASRALLT